MSTVLLLLLLPALRTQLASADLDRDRDGQCQLVLDDRARLNQTIVRLVRIFNRPDWSEQIVAMMRKWYAKAPFHCNTTPTKPSKPSKLLRNESLLRAKRDERAVSSKVRQHSTLYQCEKPLQNAVCTSGQCLMDKEANIAYCYCSASGDGDAGCESLRNRTRDLRAASNRRRSNLLRSATLPAVRQLDSPIMADRDEGSGKVMVYSRVNVECDDDTRIRVDCENGGVCYAVPNLLAFCKCSNGHTGSRCEQLNVGNILLEFDRHIGAKNGSHFNLLSTPLSFRESLVAFANTECAGHPQGKCVRLQSMSYELSILPHLNIYDED